MNYLAVLGRLDKISLAELESIFGSRNIKPISRQLAKISTHQPINIDRLGGTIKLAKIIDQTPLEYLESLPPGKIIFGYSDYSPKATKDSSWATANKIKTALKKYHRAVRIVPSQTAIVSSATAFHNLLGRRTNRIEFIKYKDIVAVSVGSQNIDAYSARDQARPARDAKVGMLPPKLAQIIINLATENKSKGVLLDPFCGTGVILQEAMLMGYHCLGTDISDRMIDYSNRNLLWLNTHYKKLPSYHLAKADATRYTWQPKPTFIASEIFLGAALSAPPSDIQLQDLKQQSKALLLRFLKNLSSQISKNTTIALAIPAWRRLNSTYSRLDIIDDLTDLGYNIKKFKHLTPNDLLYFREGQVVARQLIVLRKK